jgi:hypothetical protein
MHQEILYKNMAKQEKQEEHMKKITDLKRNLDLERKNRQRLANLKE